MAGERKTRSPSKVRSLRSGGRLYSRLLTVAGTAAAAEPSPQPLLARMVISSSGSGKDIVVIGAGDTYGGRSLPGEQS